MCSTLSRMSVLSLLMGFLIVEVVLKSAQIGEEFNGAIAQKL